MLFVKRFPLLVNGLVLGVDGGGVRLERAEMGFELFEIRLVTGDVELGVMESLELLHQLGMSSLEPLLGGGEWLSGRIRRLGHSCILPVDRAVDVAKPAAMEDRKPRIFREGGIGGG